MTADGREAALSSAASPSLTAEARAGFLARPLIARLATSVDDQPRVLPMWFLWEEPYIWMETGADFSNVAVLRRNPRAALAIDESDGALGLRAVLMRGLVDIIDDPAIVTPMVDRLYVKYLGREALATPPVRAMLAGRHVLLRFTSRSEKSWDSTGGAE